MGFTFKFPLKIDIDRVKRRCNDIPDKKLTSILEKNITQIGEIKKRCRKIPRKSMIKVLKKGNEGQIRIESWEELLLNFNEVSLILSSMLSSEVRDEDTRELVMADVTGVLWGFDPIDRYLKLKREKLLSREKQNKISSDYQTFSKSNKRKRGK